MRLVIGCLIDDVVSIEDNQIGGMAFPQDAAIHHAKRPRRAAGHLVDCLR